MSTHTHNRHQAYMHSFHMALSGIKYTFTLQLQLSEQMRTAKDRSEKQLHNKMEITYLESAVCRSQKLHTCRLQSARTCMMQMSRTPYKNDIVLSHTINSYRLTGGLRHISQYSRIVSGMYNSALTNGIFAIKMRTFKMTSVNFPT